MEKKKEASSKKTLWTLLILALLGFAGYSLYEVPKAKSIPSPKKEQHAQAPLPLSTPTAQEEVVIEKKEIPSFLGLKMGKDGLLLGQRTEMKTLHPSPPSFPATTPQAKLSSPNDSLLPTDFLSYNAPKQQERSVRFARRYTPVSLDLVGDITYADLLPDSKKMSHVRLYAKAPLKNTRCTFSVRLNHQTGKIFWKQMLHSSGNKNIDRLALRILKDLKFQQDPSKHISSGEIHLLLRLERGIVLHETVNQKVEELRDIVLLEELQEAISPFKRAAL